MSIEEIINQLEIINNWYCPRESKGANAVASAIALLKTHPDANPNAPLTLKELRGMRGEPVWVQSPGVSEYGSWRIVGGVDTEYGERTLYCDGDYTCRDYGTVWLAYRRPPKEDPKHGD